MPASFSRKSYAYGKSCPAIRLEGFLHCQFRWVSAGPHLNKGFLTERMLLFWRLFPQHFTLQPSVELGFWPFLNYEYLLQLGVWFLFLIYAFFFKKKNSNNCECFCLAILWQLVLLTWPTKQKFCKIKKRAYVFTKVEQCACGGRVLFSLKSIKTWKEL